MPSGSTTMDPSEWMKPKQHRPVRRSLYGALRKESNVKCLILTALIYGCIGAIIWCRMTRVTKVDIDFTAFPITSTREISPCDDGSIYIPTAFVVMLYLLYLVECWHCKAWHQLKFEKTDLNSAYQKIHEVRQAQPVVWWKAVCYHYVRRTREITRYRNGNAYTCTQVYYERVNSHVAAGCFFFALCGMKDVSKELIDLEKHAATKIQLSKGFLFANLATAREFQEQRAAFFQEQERYDDYMEMREGMDLSNVHFKESLISWASPDNPPWFAKIPVFWLCNFLLLSWPLRLILELNTAHIHYQVNKLFGVNYMSPSGSEMLLSAPRSHGLPINNHQYRMHNRAISSHHSRLANHHASRRRRSVVADMDQEAAAPLLQPSLDESERNTNPYLNSNNNNNKKNEKDSGELYKDSSKNLNKDQTPGDDNQHSTEGNNDTTSPSSSSGRIFFPQWRSSFFSRNFRFNRQTGYKLTRSVTLLMTKPERLQFLASTQPHGFAYFGDSDEGCGLLHDEENYEPSSSPPPPFLTPSPEEEEGDEDDHSGGASSRNNCDQNSRSRRLTNNNHHHRRSVAVTGAPHNCLAPSYSQALLLMEPSERNSVMAYVSNNNNPPAFSPLSPSTGAASPPLPPTLTPSPSGPDSNLTNEDEHGEDGFGSGAGVPRENQVASLLSSTVSRRLEEERGGHQNNWPSGTHNLPAAGSDERGDTNHAHHPTRQQQSSGVAGGSQSQVEGNDRETRDEDVISHERGASQQRQQPCSSSSSSYSVSGGSGHYHRASTTRLASAGSSTVLNTVAPREVTGVQIDLTQPIVVTVPRDPLRESAGGVVNSSSRGGGGSGGHHRFAHNFGRDDEPPTYFEALRTSRPVFLPTLARIRRCFTERDIASRFSSSANRNPVWFDQSGGGGDDVEGGCGGGAANNYHHQQSINGSSGTAGIGGDGNGASSATTTSRV